MNLIIPDLLRKAFLRPTMSIENEFFYEPDNEGEHEFADGLVVDVT